MENNLDKPKVHNDCEKWELSFGSWKDDEMSAEELIAFIRDSRLFNRTRESFD